MTLTVVRNHHESGPYRSKYFDYQRANRLVVRIDSDGSLVEVTAYAHSRESTLVDVAVDLPSMVGCPVQCSFCATGKYRRRLSAIEIVDLWKLIELHIPDQSDR